MSDLNIIPRKEICKQIGVSRDTLKNWIKDRNFPEPLKSSGREPLFDQLSVKEWLLNEGGNDEWFLSNFFFMNLLKDSLWGKIFE